jgi:hypothetical protein
MSKRIRASAFLAALALTVSVSFFGVLGGATVQSGQLGNAVLDRALDIELGVADRQQGEQLVSSGALYAVLAATGELERRADKVKEIGHPTSNKSVGCANTFSGGGPGGNNVRVNQECSLRRQAEEVVVANPTNPDNLIAGQNDSRIGFNHCGYDFSFDGGKTWGDQTPPFYQFIMADGHTADACSDPTATFDSKGNAYVAGVLFDINSAASAFVVAKSNAPIGGAFYHSPRVQPFQTYRDLPLGVVASDNNGNIFHDKEFIVADATASSPKADNVYATWTRFEFGFGPFGGHSPIFFSQSTDGGDHWSTGIEISGASSACTDFSNETNPSACDQDQGSHPIVGADGTIYVAFGNGNTPLLGVNQHLIVKCAPTANCALSASWQGPYKIGDDIGKQPVGPNAATGCPAGRQCLPPNGYRLDDFVEGSISVDQDGKVYAVWADFRNGGGTCDWAGGAPGRAATATPPCNNDVFYAFSTTGGTSWSATRLVTPSTLFGQTAQWMPWSAVSQDGKKLYIAYYDRSYGNCEMSGCNDITLATVQDAATASPSIKYARITTSSMPNLVPANNPLQAGFLGDYMWVSVDAKGNPLIAWADTRGLNGTVEEDIYFARP